MSGGLSVHSYSQEASDDKRKQSLFSWNKETSRRVRGAFSSRLCWHPPFPRNYQRTFLSTFCCYSLRSQHTCIFSAVFHGPLSSTNQEISGHRGTKPVSLCTLTSCGHRWQPVWSRMCQKVLFPSHMHSSLLKQELGGGSWGAESSVPAPVQLSYGRCSGTRGRRQHRIIIMLEIFIRFPQNNRIVHKNSKHQKHYLFHLKISEIG